MVVAPGIVRPERLQTGGVEFGGVPLALEGVHLVAAAHDHEIHFAARLVAPVVEREFWKMRLQVLQNEVFPKQAAVVGPERIPAARPADEAGVEAVETRHPGDFLLAAAVERTQEGGDRRDLKGVQVAFHRGAGNPDGGSGLGDIEQAAALAEQIFQQGVEAVEVAELEQAVDVAGEKGIHPLTIERGGLGGGEQGLRQPAVEEPLLEAHATESGQFVPEDRREMNDALAPRECVTELPAGCQG